MYRALVLVCTNDFADITSLGRPQTLPSPAKPMLGHHKSLVPTCFTPSELIDQERSSARNNISIIAFERRCTRLELSLRLRLAPLSYTASSLVLQQLGISVPCRNSAPPYTLCLSSFVLISKLAWVIMFYDASSFHIVFCIKCA